MSITPISTDQVRKMNNSEGLIIQGCGGDLQEWVDGINEMLTEAGILENGSKFTNCYSFQRDDLTCILFPFEDMQLNIGKLSMWRIQTHVNIVYKHILPILGGELMMNLTTGRLNNFINFKLTSGRLNGKGGLSAKSVRDIMTIYRSIENYAAREFGIKETHFTMPKTEKKQTDILTSAERKRLENYLIHNQNKTNIAILLCLFTGLRVSELCGLKWEDIDLDNAVLSVKRTVQRVSKNGKSQVIIGTPKSKTSIRTVPIPAFVLDILRNYRNCNDFYIITGKSKPTEPRTMQNRFKSMLKLCGIRNVNFHLLRHTYATVCIEKGFDPKTLSELLGHADAAITLNRYCHPSIQIKKDYVSRLSLTA